MSEHPHDGRIVLHARPHPDLEVQRAGFPLDHRYVEQCWAPVIGPTSTLLLRRLPWLWRAGTTVAVSMADLGQSLGVGSGTGRSSMIVRTLDRLVKFGFATPSGSGELDVFTEARPLSPRHLTRVPAWTKVLHEQLLTAHLGELSVQASRARHPSNVSQQLSERLNRLERRSPNRDRTVAR